MKIEKELLKDANALIVATDKGIKLEGPTPTLLTLFSVLTKEMTKLKGSNEEVVRKAFELAFKSDKKLKKEAKDCLKNIFDKLGKILGD